MRLLEMRTLSDRVVALGLLGALVAGPVGAVEAPWAVGMAAPPSDTLVARDDHNCVLDPSGRAWCWGRNTHGQLGNRSSTYYRPTTVQPIQPCGEVLTRIAWVQEPSRRLAEGDGLPQESNNPCGLTAGAAAYYGAESYTVPRVVGGTANGLAPFALQLPEGVTLSTLAAGRFHSCGLTDDGAVFCWGGNLRGQLGVGNRRPPPTPMAARLPADADVTSLVAGDMHTCGLTSARTIFCWGENLHGQLGDGSTANRPTPVAVRLPSGATFTTLAAGSEHTCALTTRGEAYCWGHNAHGRLGDGSTVDRSTPVAVRLPPGVTLRTLVAGSEHTCALTTAGEAYCWGRNAYGQLGDGSTAARPAPSPVRLPSGLMFVGLAAGTTHSCGLTAVGTAYCWGHNADGQLGDGSTYDRLAPVRVQLPPEVTLTTLAAGRAHSCGLTAAGRVYCWGHNGEGQLGDGGTASRPTPGAVPDFAVTRRDDEG